MRRTELKLEEVLAEIEGRGRKKDSGDRPGAAAAGGRPVRHMGRPPRPCSLSAFYTLQEASKDLGRRVGGLPPVPNTPRARLGLLAVKLVKRCLFWYSDPLVRFHASVAATFEEVGRLLDRLRRVLPILSAVTAKTEETERRLAMLCERNEALEREVRVLRRQLEEVQAAGG